MIDIQSIKANYSQMLDNQLINTAIQDGHSLQPEALHILKEEFKKRNLDNSYIEDIDRRILELHEAEIQQIKESDDDKYEDLLWKYILTEKENNTADNKIVAGVVERGLDEDRAKEMVAGTDGKLAELVNHYDTQVITGGLSFVAGLFITLLTYSQAAISGGVYIVAWGAILFGAFKYFKAIPQRKKYKSLSKKLSPGIKN